MRSITITRVRDRIFHVTSKDAFWSDGSGICDNVAFIGDRPVLSNIEAQKLDRSAGLNPGIIISQLTILNTRVIEAARALSVGETVTVEGLP